MQRNISIDIAKGFSIIAIVLGHISFMYPKSTLVNTRDFIYIWHVPVFFILAGCFLKDEQLVHPCLFFKKKFFSLYIKILYFYIPAVLLHNVLISWNWYSLNDVREYSIIDFIKQSILAVFFAGREPILGAMWFVYVLFMALIGLSIISFFVHRITKDQRQLLWVRFIILLFFCVISGIASNKYNFTIKRFSNVFTAMYLIYVGKILFQNIKLSFNNVYVCIISLLIVFELSCMLGGVSLNANIYRDILQLTFAGISALYVIIFIGKRIPIQIGKCLAYIGKNSFYIMALHFVGFKLCSEILSILNYTGANIYELTPNINNDFSLYILYSLFGVGLPLLFMIIFRFSKKIIFR